MVPFGTSSAGRPASPRLERNGSVEIIGEAAPGISTSTAMMDTMEKLAALITHRLWPRMDQCPTGKRLLKGVRSAGPVRDFCWWVFLYCQGGAVRESWSVPLSVMLVVP